jgi:hypothetical protein
VSSEKIIDASISTTSYDSASARALLGATEAIHDLQRAERNATVEIGFAAVGESVLAYSDEDSDVSDSDAYHG